jgi:hypothetical protein
LWEKKSEWFWPNKKKAEENSAQKIYESIVKEKNYNI